MNQLARFLGRHGGVATLAQIRGVGLEHGVRRAVRSGEVRGIRRGVYALATADPLAVLAGSHGARLCGPSAAASYGLWSGRRPELHLAVPPNRARCDAPGIRHWIRVDFRPIDDCWRVRLEDALRQVVDWCAREDAIACLDTAIDRYGTDLRDVFAAAGPRARLLAAAARPGSGSGPESIVRQRLHSVGIAVEQQVLIPGVGRVDFLIGDLVIEIDGAAYHSDRAAFENDRRRDAALVALGYRVLRFTYRQVFEQWPTCLDRIQRAMSAR